MNKNKFIAATITTLVLFAIVRAFTPEPEIERPEVLEPDSSIEEAVDEEVSEDVFEEPKKLVPIKPTPKPQVKFQVKKQKESEQDMSAFFSEQSEYVYFKIKDGLALVGGDIVIGELTDEQLKDESLQGKLLKDKPKKSKLWPSAEIPFGFNEGFPQTLRKTVLEAVKYFNSQTVISFIPAETDVDEDALVFKLREGAPCSSYLGRVGGLQPIYLNSTCSAQDVLHEILHALGFVHEQQREGRDAVLEVLWANIDEYFQFNFALLPDSLVHQYKGSVFDLNFSSVMMYHDEAFAKPGTKSIKSKRGVKISPISSGLAGIDKKRLEYLYGD